jgi:N,N'-diacetyllegionaminate synthase
MLTMRDEFGVAVGYSDHTQGWEVAVSAVALGATVIEKHITLDCKASGPDHAASLEPDDFAEMVRSIRLTEVALGDGRKAPDQVETDVRAVARRSIVARRRIRKGDVITSDDLAVKRPAAGLSPMLWDSVVGTRAVRDFEPDESVEL